MTKYFLTIISFIIISSSGVLAQQLTAQDSSFLSKLHTELNTDSLQKHRIDSVYTDAVVKLHDIDTSIKAWEKADVSEEELNSKVLELNTKKKDIRDIRDMQIQLLLNDAQRKIYIEKFKPTKPAVLHFGMNHDRANCNVCK
ncbi:MAG: hypothetical protein RL204_804 [Bacteroidota bacterium]|jgi:uncharacterized membrane protein